jgi:hypothetical protein
VGHRVSLSNTRGHRSCAHTTKKTVRAPGTAPPISKPGWKEIRKLRLLHGRARSCESSSTKQVEDQDDLGSTPSIE